MTKVNVSGFIKNITDNEILTIDTIGIKNKNKLNYLSEKDLYTLKVLSPEKIILERNNDLINSVLLFENKKTTTSSYYIKKEEITLEININTKNIKISDNMINIAYTIIDSNTDYQYKIEMSE